EPAAGAGGRLSEPLLRVPLPPLAFLTLLLEVLAGASAGPGCVVPCATLTFELEVVCGAFCPCVTVASAKRLTHVTDPRIRNDIGGPSWNCRSTTALNPGGAVFSSVVSAKGDKRTFEAYSRYETLLNMTQTTMPITVIAAAKIIRKVLVSIAMERPFFPETSTMRLFLRICKCEHVRFTPESGHAIVRFSPIADV